MRAAIDDFFFFLFKAPALQIQVTEAAKKNNNQKTDEAQSLCYKKQDAPNLQKKSRCRVIVRDTKSIVLEIYSYYYCW